ncbi:MAG: tRNA-dihydrouridine synthase [Candidatus Woesearchaeota archaeon]
MHNLCGLRLKNQFFLAPLHGVNCLAFRLLCKEYGAGLVSTPMIHVNWIVKEGKIPPNIELSKPERPIIIQLVGADVKMIKKAAEIVEPYADVIDINCGCPVFDAVKLEMGGYMMKKPEVIGKMVGAICSVTNKPVTAKIRSGWDDKHLNFLEVGKIVEDNGASGITLHARTVKQGYSGIADWGHIKKLKDKLNIKVIGNGDANDGGLARKMIDDTGCDFVMIGRGAIGYPFIFKECLDDGYKPTIDERKECVARFIGLYESKQKHHNFSELRQHMMWMLKGLHGASKLRAQLTNVKDVDSLKSSLEKFF